MVQGKQQRFPGDLMAAQTPYSRQYIDEHDIDAVADVLRSDFLTQGPMVPQFEERIAAITEARYAIAVNSATSGLHLAMMALDVGPKSLVWTSANSFAASANCALYVGAEVDFVDIDPTSYIITQETLIAKLENSKKKPDVLIVVHFGGLSCDMEKISEVCRRESIKLVEDSSHAIGASYNGAPVGSCEYSDISVFSFHPVKIITTGEGGVATTNDATLAKKMSSLRTHGIVREDLSARDKIEHPWLYEQRDLGYNYRLTDIAAALGISQISKLHDSIKKRNEIADRYKRELRDTEIQWQNWAHSAVSSYHLFVVRLPSSQERLRKFQALRAAGYLVNVHYIPIYHHPYYRENGFESFSLDGTESYYRTALSLPCFYKMSDKVIDEVSGILKA